METPPQTTTSKRPYFRATTSSQREFLFRLAAETGNISQAARQAHVGRSTYYHWRDRYQAHGVAGLAQERSRAPHRTRIPPVPEEVRHEVLAYYREHPDERSYRMIAYRLRQRHGRPVISHTKVGEIIRAARAAGQWDEPPPSTPPPAAAPPALPVVHTPQPGQTVHIDLCVVPLSHDGTHPLAAANVKTATAEATSPSASASLLDCPGQVFANPELPYAEQMRTYVQQQAARRAAKGKRKHRRRQKQAARQALNAQSDELRVARRRQRQMRRQEDAAWRERRIAHRAAAQRRRQLTPAERKAMQAAWQAEQASWRTARQQRQHQMAQRQAEDAAWRQARQEIRQALAALAEVPLVTTWLAILVVVDSATRLCLQLPLFVTGPHVTAEEIVAALRTRWPARVEFVISDNGAQFIAQAFARFADEMGFLHVRIAPHHPQTNGIAERFVLTLKQWLEKRSWHGSDELAALLAEFIAYYNDRPHQGAERKGLSPNEYAAHLRACSRC